MNVSVNSSFVIVPLPEKMKVLTMLISMGLLVGRVHSSPKETQVFGSCISFGEVAFLLGKIVCHWTWDHTSCPDTMSQSVTQGHQENWTD